MPDKNLCIVSYPHSLQKEEKLTQLVFIVAHWYVGRRAVLNIYVIS